MADDFGSDFITISDEDGNEYVFEHLDTIEMNDTFYFACLPTDIDESDPNYGIILLKQEEDEEDGELYLVVPDEEESEAAYDEYMRRLYEDWDEDNEDDTEDYDEE